MVEFLPQEVGRHIQHPDIAPQHRTWLPRLRRKDAERVLVCLVVNAHNVTLPHGEPLERLPFLSSFAQRFGTRFERIFIAIVPSLFEQDVRLITRG